jgi:fucokinase
VVESDAASLSAGSLVEHSLLLTPGKGAHRLGAGAVVSQVLWHSTPLELPDDTMYFQCPLKTPRGAEVVHVVAAVADDFKSATFAGEPLATWMKRNAVTPRDVWPASVPAEKRTLWNARLFPATARRGPCPLALALVSSRKLPTARWRASPRYSMADVLDLCDPQAIVAHREAVAAHLQARDMVDATEAGMDRPLATDLYHYATPDAYREATAVLIAFGSRSPADPLHAVRQARLFWTAAQLAQRSDHPDPAARYNAPPLADQAFTRIALASELGHPPAASGTDRAGARLTGAPGTEVLATAPVRLDLAGGWSDTPPYCYEAGGQVVNLAIDLEGAPPVRVSVKLLAEPKLVLESHDLGRRVDLPRLAPEISLSDPFALHKVALHMLGLGTPSKSATRNAPSAVARGLHLTTECRVPKGSGLGTSSILAGAVLAALHRAIGKSPSLATIYEQTLLLEQRLSTGGGWQDQVGGLAGGVKSTVTTPGLPQKLAVESLDLPSGVLDELDDRLVVYYSGQQRLAKDILRRVVGRWLAREPSTVLTLSALKQGAASLRAELLGGRLDRAARHVDRYWELKKLLYPGSTTPAIDLLLLQLRPHYLAAGLAGAGGGGFAYFLTASAAASRELTARLHDLSSRPGSLGTPYAASLNREGLKVKVLRPRG